MNETDCIPVEIARRVSKTVNLIVRTKIKMKDAKKINSERSKVETKGSNVGLYLFL